MMFLPQLVLVLDVIHDAVQFLQCCHPLNRISIDPKVNLIQRVHPPQLLRRVENVQARKKEDELKKNTQFILLFCLKTAR